MELNIGIEIRDPKLVFDLFETSTKISAGQKKEIADGVSIQLKSYRLREAVDFPTILNVIAYISKNVALPIAVTILSNYLYDKLKDRKTSKVTINYRPIEINAKKIEQLILEILEKEKNEV